MQVTCELQTLTQRGIQSCRQPAVFKRVMAYGKVMKLCDKHHAGLHCTHGAVRCLCKRHNHGGKRCR